MEVLELIKACFKDAILKGDYMYFFDNRIQAVCKMNTYNFNMKIISKYEDEEKFYGRKIFDFYNKYFIVEGNSARVLVCDKQTSVESKAFHMYIPSIRCDNRDYEAYEYNNYIWFFPSIMSEKILCFDMYCQDYVNVVFEELFLRKIIGEKIIQTGYTCLYEDEIWVPVRGTSFYVKYNLSKRKSELFQMKNKNIMLSGICFDGRDIWTVQDKDGSIVCDENGKIEIPEKLSRVRIYDTKEYIIVAPRHLNELTLICKDEYKSTIVELPIEDTAKKKNQKRNITGLCESDTFIFLFCHEESVLYVLNKMSLDLKGIMLLCENYTYHYFEQEGEKLEEHEDINLKHFIQFMQRDIKRNSIQKKYKDANVRGKTCLESIKYS